MKSRLADGYDFILLVYPDVQGRDASLQSRTAQLENLFEKAGLIK